MNLEPKLVPVLLVALITWGGVLLYLLRVDLLTRQLQNQVDQETQSEPEDSLPR